MIRYALGDLDRVLDLSTIPCCASRRSAVAHRRLRALARRRHHVGPRDRPDDPAARGGDAEEPVRPALHRHHRVRRGSGPQGPAQAGEPPARPAGSPRSLAAGSTPSPPAAASSPAPGATPRLPRPRPRAESPPPAPPAPPQPPCPGHEPGHGQPTAGDPGRLRGPQDEDTTSRCWASSAAPPSSR